MTLKVLKSLSLNHVSRLGYLKTAKTMETRVSPKSERSFQEGANKLQNQDPD